MRAAAAPAPRRRCRLASLASSANSRRAPPPPHARFSSPAAVLFLCSVRDKVEDPRRLLLGL